MQKKDQIADLFKDTFENFEAPVRPELWNNIASQIQVPVSPAIPDGTSVTQVATVASKISGSLIAWVGGAALVAVVGTGYYFYENSNSETAEKAIPTAVTESENNIVLPTPVSDIQNNEAAENNNASAPLTQNNKDVTGSQVSQQTPANQSQADMQQPVTQDPAQVQENRNQDQPGSNQAIPGQVQTSTTNTNAGSPAATPTATVENSYVKAVITASPASGTAPLQVSFSSSAANETNEWQFGDGSETVKGTQVQHTFSQAGSYLVMLKTTGENGIAHTELVRVIVHSDLNISNIPNVFTPNGDGLNDEFSITAAEGISIEVSIFDKSGRLVHKYTGSENSWNGKLNNNQDAEAGTYFYVIFAAGQNGEKNTQRGTLTLRR